MAEWTECEKANNNFFGNIVNINMQLEELKIYLNEVNSFIGITHIKLHSNKIKNLDSDTLDNLKYHFEHTQGEILRKSIIIAVVILLESEIDVYCQTFKESKKIAISYYDFKGDLLDKFKFFLTKILFSDFDFQGTLWQDIVGLYEIRNSLVHKCGSVSNFGKRKTVENFIQRNKSFEIDGNEKIYISHEACIDSIKIIEIFFNEITNLALKEFPDKHYNSFEKDY